MDNVNEIKINDKMSLTQKKTLANKIGYGITVITFLAVIFGFSVAGIISPDREFSDMENRKLSQVPEFTFENLKSGKFTADIETYLADQLFMKDALVSTKTTVDRLMLKSYQNDVYLADDGYYIQDYQENSTLVDKNITALNDFAEAVRDSAEVSFLLAPNAVSVLSDKLPAVDQTDDQLDTIKRIEKNLSEDINFYCAYDDLKSADENGTQVFYKTDHHWTAEGAKTAFDGLMNVMGETVPEVKYSVENLDGFYGTLYSKAPCFTAKCDTVSLYTNEDNEITVNYVGDGGDNEELAKSENTTRTGLFDDSFKKAKDKYKTFLGGNFDLVEIETQGESDENVLIIKDSYANIVMPYFCDKYKHISVIDMRYYHMEDLSVSEYVKEKNITKVIFLYNVDFINSDNNFMWLD